MNYGGASQQEPPVVEAPHRLLQVLLSSSSVRISSTHSFSCTSSSGRGHQAGVERLEEAEARLLLLMLPREVTLAASSTL
mmetsp:Transcript_40729/g.68196  ORF Transcript_40729/g.68196 Transcript_40729/m.68196 type:complete len:80 (+) Transcript_40729:67-306(+)